MGDVDLTRAERVLHRGGVAQDPEHDPVEEGDAGLPVLVEADERHVVPRHPLAELEGACAPALLLDRREGGGVDHAPARDHGQVVGAGSREPEAHGARVDFVGGREVLEPAEEAAARRLVLDPLEVGEEGLRVEPAARVGADAVPQPERGARPVLGQLPRLGEVGLGLEARPEGHEVVVELEEHGDVGEHDVVRVERHQVGVDADGEGPALLRG